MQPPFHRLAEFVSLTSQDMDVMNGWLAGHRKVSRSRTLRREGDPVAGVYFLLEGWACSSLMLRNGRRQIVKVHLPGDMLGVPSLVLPTAGETLEAVTDIKVSLIPTATLGKLFEHSPRLAVGLFLSTQREHVAMIQKLSWVGAGNAMERMSAFLLDLFARLDAGRLTHEGRFDFPLTQPQLGELLGLTAVHVNRTLKRLDQTGFIVRGRGWLQILNFDGLLSLAPNLPPRFSASIAWSRLGGEPASPAIAEPR